MKTLADLIEEEERCMEWAARSGFSPYDHRAKLNDLRRLSLELEVILKSVKHGVWTERQQASVDLEALIGGD